MVRYFHGTKEVRITRANFEEAHKDAKAAALSLANGELDVLTLRSDDRLSYVRAIEALKPTGVQLEHAVSEYVAAHALLGGSSVLEAIRLHVKRQPLNRPTITVAQVVDELVQQKSEKGRNKVYVKDLRLRLQRFAKAFACPISSVCTAQIEQFLLGLKLSGRTQNNYRRIIGTLFRFAIRRGYLPKEHDGIAGVDLATEDPQDIEIFCPDQMSQLLAVAQPEIVPFLALGAFAGLRHAEIKRLDWSDVRLQEGFIELKARDAKTRVRRLIPIPENLRQWLLPHRLDQGGVTPFENMAKQLHWLAEDAGMPWKHNALRHSFVSYRVAETQNIPQVAYESGNSPRIIERAYLKRVTPAEAQRWFSIVPPQ
jgi:integrase